MTWRTHLLGGVAAALCPLLLATGDTVGDAVFATGSPYLWTSGLLDGIGALGALLPDLDAAGAKAARLSLGQVRIGGTTLDLTPLRPVAALLSRTLGHRGPLHSLVAAVLVGVLLGTPLAVALGSWQPAVALMLGYASHLLLDACTMAGVPLLWPFSHRRLHLLPRMLRVRTGSPEEDVFFALAAVFALALLVPRLMNSN